MTCYTQSLFIGNTAAWPYQDVGISLRYSLGWHGKRSPFFFKDLPKNRAEWKGSSSYRNTHVSCQLTCTSRHWRHPQLTTILTGLIQLWQCDVLRLRRCELIPLFIPLSHCHKQRNSLASRSLFAAIAPLPLKFLIALCCLFIHALSLPEITMGYSARIF